MFLKRLSLLNLVCCYVSAADLEFVGHPGRITIWDSTVNWVPQQIPTINDNCTLLLQFGVDNIEMSINAPNCAAGACNFDVQGGQLTMSNYGGVANAVLSIGEGGLNITDMSQYILQNCSLNFISSSSFSFADLVGSNPDSIILQSSYLYGSATDLSLVNNTTVAVQLSSAFLGVDPHGENNLDLLTLEGVFATSNSTYLATDAGYFAFSTGTITVDSSSYMGPSIWQMSGGVIINAGTAIIGGHLSGSSSLSGGVIQGTGICYFSGDCQIDLPFTQDQIVIGNNYEPFSDSFAQHEAVVTVNNVMSGSITLFPLGVLQGEGLILGSITNKGNINPSFLLISQNSTVTDTLVLGNYPINSVGGTIGEGSGISMIGGSVTQTSSSNFAPGALGFVMTGGQLFSDSSSYIGPTQLAMIRGEIVNNGTMTIGSYAGTFSSGSSSIAGTITGNGGLYLAQDTLITAPLSQGGGLFIGEGLNTSHILLAATATATLNNTFTGTVRVAQSGFLEGRGIVTGNLFNSGHVNPSSLVLGTALVSSEALAIRGPSYTNIGGVMGSGTELISLYNGSVFLNGSSSFAYGALGLVMTGGLVSIDASSSMGPAPMNLSKGTIVNSGSLTFGLLSGGAFHTSSSTITGVSLSGSGTVYIAGTVNLSADIRPAALVIGEGNGLVTPGVLNLLSTYTGEMTLTPEGVLKGSGFSVGTITNSGLITSSAVTIGASSGIANTLTISPQFPLINNGVIGGDNQTLNLIAGTVLQSASGSFGNRAKSVTIQGGVLIQGTSSSLAYGATLLKLQSGTISSDETSLMGPSAVMMSGGYVNNEGIWTIGQINSSGFIPSNSTLTGGVISGSGTLYIAGNTELDGPLTLDKLSVGQGYFAPDGLIPARAILSVGGLLTTDLSIAPLGSIIGDGGVIVGTITSQGSLSPNNLIIGSLESIRRTLTLQGSSLNNTAGAKLGFGSLSVTLSGGSITNDRAFVGGGNRAQLFTISGGSLSNHSGGTLFGGGGQCKLLGGLVVNDADSYVGPVSLQMSGGTIINEGIFTFGASYNPGGHITAGAFIGGGQIQVLGTAYFSTPLVQEEIIIGSNGFLYANSNAQADVTVETSGALLGTGTISGNTTVLGTLSPGSSLDQNGSMTFIGDLALEAGSTTRFLIGPGASYTQLMIEGSFSAQDRPTLLIAKQKQTSISGIVTFPYAIRYATTSTTIDDFNLQSLYATRLIPETLGYSLEVNFDSLGFNNYPGNAGVVAVNLGALNGHCSPTLQDNIDILLTLNEQAQAEGLLELCPQFKLIQYSLEKLLFTQEDCFANRIYGFKEGLLLYADAGFNQYAQKQQQPPIFGYNPYHVNSWTENVGFTYGSKQGSIGIDLGAIQSSFKFSSYPAQAYYNTLTAMLGYAGKTGPFEVGFDLARSQSWIRSQRSLTLFDLVATNNHQAWNWLSSISMGYRQKLSHWSLKPYDKVGYIYGKEVMRPDTGASVFNLVMQDETLCVIRNTLGLLTEYAVAYMSTSLDLAWVYESIRSDLRTKGLFSGTASTMNFYVTPQKSNFAKIGFNFMWHHRHFAAQVSYQALIAGQFLEQTARLSLGARF